MPAKTRRSARPQKGIPGAKATAATAVDLATGASRVPLQEDVLAVAILLGLTALYFVPALMHGNARVLSSMWNDTWNQYFYWREFGFSALRHGELPLWNPYIFSGTPYIAGTQSAIFYPLNLIHLFLGTALAINVGIALHCFLAAFFTYVYCRYMSLTVMASMISAITFAFGAPFFLHIYSGHLSNLSTMPWLPLHFMGIEAFLRNKRLKYVLLSAVPLALQLCAGHPQYLFYSMIAVSLYFVIGLWLRAKPREMPYFITGFFLFIVSGTALSAVQLLPALELTRYSVREALTYEWISTFSLPPENVITAFFPSFFGDFLVVPYWGKNNLWESSLYLGVVPLVLAGFALFCHRSRTVKTLFFIAVASFILAVGKHTPLLWLLYHYVPGFNLFRGVSKFIFVYAFGLAVVAGYGLDAISEWARARTVKSTRLSYGLLAAAASFVLLAVAVHYSGDVWRQWIEAYIRSGPPDTPLPALTSDFFRSTTEIMMQTILRTSGIAALLGVVLLVFVKAKKLSANLFTGSLIFLTALDLWTFGHRYLVTFDPAKLKMDPELKAFLEKDVNPSRWTIPKLPDVNMGMIERLENIGGYDAIVLKNYSELVNFALGSPVNQPNMIMGIAIVSPIFNMLNVKYYVIDAARKFDDPALTMLFRNQRYKAYRNVNAMPRSFIVHQARMAVDREQALFTLASAEFDPAASAVVAEPIPNLPDDPNLRSPVPEVLHHGLNKIIVRADPIAPGLLILGDAFYPGWKAFVDGKESPIYRVNYVMRGVFLPPGHHEVEFRYDPVSFKLGVSISLTSAVLLIGFLIWSKVKPGLQRDSL
jgi:hypothetical protein